VIRAKSAILFVIAPQTIFSSFYLRLFARRKSGVGRHIHQHSHAKITAFPLVEITFLIRLLLRHSWNVNCNFTLFQDWRRVMSDAQSNYQAKYFQHLKSISGRYNKKKLQNKNWNHTDEGRRWKREYMRQWYYDHRAEILEARKTAINK
jgi:hypothetical protein